MARERFRILAKDAHFNGQEMRATYPADSIEHLRELISQNAPNLTIVRIAPLAQALRSELYEARKNTRILPQVEKVFELAQIDRDRYFARRELIEERLKSCCDLAEILGPDAQENLANLLRRFDRNVERSHALDGLDASPFSFSFAWGAPAYNLNGGVIFHASMNSWSTHT